MSEILAFGIKSFKVGAIDPVTGLGTGMVSIGDIFKDTCNLEEADPEIVKIYAEQSINPRKLLTTPGEETLKFSLMSISADSLIAACGGTKTTLDGVVTWNKPENGQITEKYYEIETLDGTKIIIPRGAAYGKKNFQFRRNGILLIDVTIVPLQPKVAGLAAMQIVEPPAAA